MSKFTVADVVQNAMAEDPVKLQTALHDVLMDKVQSAVLAKRDEMINNYYTSPEDDEDELDDEELEDDEDSENDEDDFDEEDFEEVDLDDEDFSEEDEDEENQ